MKNRHRGFSAGSIAMILLTAAVIVSCIYVLRSLYGVQKRLFVPEWGTEAILSVQMSPTAPVQVLQQAAEGSTQSFAGAVQTDGEQSNSTVLAADAAFSFGGTVALETSIRQSGYDKENGIYDFSEILQDLNPYMQDDLSWIQLDNSIIPGGKLSDTVCPDEAAGMLVAGGIDYVSLGFSKALDNGIDGIRSTQLSMDGAGIDHNGVYRSAEDAALEQRIVSIQGIRVALLQYTEALSSAGKKSIKKTPFAVSLLSEAEDDIRKVKMLGAQLIVVRLNWGSQGKTKPTQDQKNTAQKLAAAGADIIIGSGSRRVQNVEYLSAVDDKGHERKVLCAYSLGTLLQASTKSGAMESVILRLSVHFDQENGISISDVSYVPTFIWHLKQGGKTFFRVIPSTSLPPNGMTSAQEKTMRASQERIQKIMQESGIPVYDSN